MHTERALRYLLYPTDLSTVPQLKDGSFDFGDGIIGPSEADRKYLDYLREQSEASVEPKRFRIPKVLQRPFLVAMTVGGIGFVVACSAVTQGSEVQQSSSTQVAAVEGRLAGIKAFSPEEKELISLFLKNFESIKDGLDQGKVVEGESYENKVASLTDFVIESSRALSLINRDSNFDIEVVAERLVMVSGVNFRLENPVNSLILMSVLENRYKINQILVEESADNSDIESLKSQEKQILRLAGSPIIIVFADNLLEVYPSQKWAEIGEFFGRVTDLGYPMHKFIVLRDIKVEGEEYEIGVHISIPVNNGLMVLSKKFFDLGPIVHEWAHMFQDLKGMEFEDKNLSAYKRMVDDLGGNNELSYVSEYPQAAQKKGFDIDAEDQAECLRLAYTEPATFRDAIYALISLQNEEALHAAEVLEGKAEFCLGVFEQ